MLAGKINIMEKIPVAFSSKKTILFDIGFESFHMESRFWEFKDRYFKKSKG
jgi:hypothetical protein